MHLKASVRKAHENTGDLLWAPALDNTREHHLLRVVGDECDKVINDLLEVTIQAPADNRMDHAFA